MRLFFSFLFFSALLSAQEIDTLYQKSYKTHPKLKWEDFLLEKNELETEFAASVSTGFDYSWNYEVKGIEQIFEYEVNAWLYPGSSWVVASKKDSTLLAHEQVHYDISELHARKLRKLMSGYSLGNNIRKDLKVLYKQVKSSHYKMQNLYDAETDHSKTTEIQLKWRGKVDSLLQVYKLYQ